MKQDKTIALNVTLCIALLLLYVGSVLAQSEAVEQSLHVSVESEPVLTMGEVNITHGELDAHMRQLPEEDRAQAVASMERIDKLLQGLVFKKALYEAGRDRGLLEDSSVGFQVLLAISDILAETQMERHVESRLLDDYEQQAREMFLANPDRFRGSPTYSFTHVLVSTSSRSEAEAMRRILEAHEKVQSGENLKALVPEYSEDSASKESGGAYDRMSLDSLDRNFARTVSRLETPGEVSGPVRSRFGWHIIRLDERHEPKRPEWEDVREQAIEAARRQHKASIREAYTSSLLDSDAIEVVPGSIERFQKRNGFDPEASRQDPSATE